MPASGSAGVAHPPGWRNTPRPPTRRPGRVRHESYESLPCRFDIVTASRDLKLVVAVLRIRLLGVSLRHRTLLAVADHVDPRRIDPVVDQVPLGRRRATLAERQVVLIGATRITVARHADTEAGVGVQHRDL